MSDRNEMLSNDINNAYIAILKEELRPAMGCTEPIAIAYLECVEPTLGGLMMVTLKNGCKECISRKYLPAFKKYLGL